MAPKKSYRDRVHDQIKAFMLSQNLWEDYLQIELPKSYEKYGDMILFTTPTFSSVKWLTAGDPFWELICDLYKVKKVGLKGRIVNDDFRTPQAKLVFGTSPLTEFNDNGIKYSWDIEKLMFSAGNIKERHRIATLNCTSHVIVDFFAGIGYFTLPYLVHAKAKFVHACEWNPIAVEALKNNLELNKVSDRCTVYEGDNRKVCPRNIADRINLGLIPTSTDYLELAADVLKPSGGILYIHENVTSNFPSDQLTTCEECMNILQYYSPLRPLGTNCFRLVEMLKLNNTVVVLYKNFCLNFTKIEWYNCATHLSHLLLSYFEKCKTGVWNVSVREVHKIKSYAPHIDHLVFTVHCYPDVDC